MIEQPAAHLAPQQEVRVEFEVTPERAQLRATVRRIVSDHAELSQLLAAMADPDADTGQLWQALVRIGVIGLRVPSRSQEPASSFADVGVVLQELGRGPACVPYLGTAVLAPQVLADCGTELAHELAAPLSTGETLATVSLEHDFEHLESIQLQASNDPDDRWHLTGTDRFVLEGAAADLLLLPALIGDGLGLFAVDGDAAGFAAGCADVDGSDAPGSNDHSRPDTGALAGPGRAGGVGYCVPPGLSRKWPWPASRWAEPSGAWSDRSNTPSKDGSSAYRSARSRRSSIAAPTCSPASNWPARWRNTPAGA